LSNLKTIEFRIATLSITSPNLVTVKYKNVLPHPSVNEISELITRGINLINEQPFILLTDLSDTYGEWDNETKIYVANHKQLNELKVAEAIVSKDFATHLLVAGYKTFNNKSNVKTFNDIQQALDWLSNY